MLREQIVKNAPELAGESKRLSDEETAFKTTTIHLDGLDRVAIIHLVTKAMRDTGASEREIEAFKEDANHADYDSMLAKAIDWGAPVHFLKDGQPWIRGNSTVLAVERQLCASDGTIELASDERA